MKCPVEIKEFHIFNFFNTFLSVSHTLSWKIKKYSARYQFHTIMRPKIAITEEFLKVSVGTWPLKGHKAATSQHVVLEPGHDYLPVTVLINFLSKIIGAATFFRQSKKLVILCSIIYNIYIYRDSSSSTKMINF